MTLSAFDVRSEDDFDNAFGKMQQSHMEAVLIVAGSLAYSSTRRIADLSLQARLPSCFPFREAVEAGGLISFGADLVEIARQVAIYLDKIMRGAKPADLRRIFAWMVEALDRALLERIAAVIEDDWSGLNISSGLGSERWARATASGDDRYLVAN